MSRRSLRVLVFIVPLLTVAVVAVAWNASVEHARRHPAEGADIAVIVLVAGLFGTLLVGSILLALLQTHTEAERIARSMIQSLRASEEKYRSVVDSVKEVIFRTDGSERLTFLNPAWVEVTGFEAEAALNRKLSDYFLEEDREDGARSLRAAARGESDSCRFEIRCRTRSGPHRWIEVVARAVPRAGESDGGTSGTLRDITEHRRAEMFQAGQQRVLELLATGERLEVVLDELARTIEAQHPEILCSILLVDPTGSRLRHTVSGSLPSGYVHGTTEVPIDPGMGSCGAAAWLKELVVSRNLETDPRWEPYRELALAHGLRACWSDPILDRSGNVLGTLAIYYRRPAEPTPQDASLLHVGARLAGIAIERKREEADLAIARDQALEAARLKSQFLANMSHELRTPLNGVIGMTELALETDLDAEPRDYMTAVRSSARHLVEMIDELLDFSRLEIGRLEIDREPFGIRNLVDDALKPLALKARTKGLEFESRIAEEVPDILVGDSHRIRQILLNLVSNALKFTEEGSIEVELAASPSERGEVLLSFTVSDTGIGIPHDKHELVFLPFVQADGSTTRRFGGTGLGLAISKELVELMGGTIAVESGSGRGSTFRFTVRVGLGEPALAVPSVSPPETASCDRPAAPADADAREDAVAAPESRS